MWVITHYNFSCSKLLLAAQGGEGMDMQDNCIKK